MHNEDSIFHRRLLLTTFVGKGDWARRPSGRASDSGSRGPGFEPMVAV